MKSRNMYRLTKISLIATIAALFLSGCSVPKLVAPPDVKPAPATYGQQSDTTNSAQIKWTEFFKDTKLVALIDTALLNNFDLRSADQDIIISQNDVLIRKALLYPTVSAGGSLGLDKTGRYTASGAGNAATDITHGHRVPEPLPDIVLGFKTSWEADIWSKLKNSRKAAFLRYLKTKEGKNFLITNLVADIANTYYDLIAADNQLDVLTNTIKLQQNALEVVKNQKQAAMTTELAVKQFEAQVANSKSQIFDIRQRIFENENKINFLIGRYPRTVQRDKNALLNGTPPLIHTGIPAQLLANRPDIRQAELELEAAKLDVKAARAEFYPSLGISGAVGYQAFNPKYLFRPLESLAFSLAGDISAPIINRGAIKAEFNKANATQLMALYDYQKTILNGYIEVSNELSRMDQLDQLYGTKSQETNLLNQSVDISQDLFKSARADYLEILIAQRDAINANLDKIDARKNQFTTAVNIYKALGGGWR